MQGPTTAGVLRGTTSSLDVSGVEASAAIPKNTLVESTEDRRGLFIRTGAQWGPGFRVEITWHPAPDPQMKSGFEELAELDVTCASQVRVDAPAGGDFLILDVPGGAARLRLSADGRPMGLVGEAEDDEKVVERFCLELWQREHEAPPVVRTLTSAELSAALVAARAAAARD